ncbi:LolA family protein [Saccharomonospora saliphila]|uniref:LolA family protein n=1 Tax=Saccharomonospora saliphila TaxID=369829 RepID=UPI00039B2AE1|nr:hypothetical protein [Saccharomonospora saliphila]
MNPRRRATVIAVAGTAAGATGLGVLAVPAGAGTAPELPPVEAQALVESVLRGDAPALSGTVAVESDLGLPSMRGIPALQAESARVFYDGEGRSRIALERESGEFTVVASDEDIWTYDSADNTAGHTELPADAQKPARGHDAVDPTALAQRMVAAAGESSTISVDGTASVADRPAYELVLTPKPDERTLLREVRIAVDSETRLPLRLSVLTHGTTEPAVEVGFDDIDFGAQPAGLFEFSPPENAEVTERTPGDGAHREGPRDDGSVETVGEGWDTVVLTRAPAGLAALGRDSADNPTGEDTPGPERVRELLGQVGERVSGPYGSGYLISTSAATALVTDDGRVAVGAVPEQVLTEALSSR